jgi:hypothetical protein
MSRPMSTRAALSPLQVAPLFLLIPLINAAAVATRFDLVAAKLPAGVALGVMLAVVLAATLVPLAVGIVRERE